MVDLLVRAGAAIDTADVSGIFDLLLIESHIIRHQVLKFKSFCEICNINWSTGWNFYEYKSIVQLEPNFDKIFSKIKSNFRALYSVMKTDTIYYFSAGYEEDACAPGLRAGFSRHAEDHVWGAAGAQGQQPADQGRGEPHAAPQGCAVRPMRGHRIRARPGAQTIHLIFELTSRAPTSVWVWRQKWQSAGSSDKQTEPWNCSLISSFAKTQVRKRFTIWLLTKSAKIAVRGI